MALIGTIIAPNDFAFKNRIINGGMTTDQRNTGASQTFTAAGALAYAVDRFFGFCTGANVTGAQVAGSGANQFRYRFTGAASVTAVGFGQRIEQKNSYDLAGSTATLSADLAISATLTTVTWTASYATTTADTFGSLASPTVTQIATGTFTVTSTVTNFNAQITVPAAATTGIQIVFSIGALTAGLTWTVGNVQLEAGSVASPFERRDIGRELMMCQRYFTRSETGLALNFGVQASTTSAEYFVQFPVAMRTSPTLSFSSLANFSVYSWAGGASRVPASMSIAYSASRKALVQFGWAGALASAGVGVSLDGYNGDFLTFSAEL